MESEAKDNLLSEIRWGGIERLVKFFSTIDIKCVKFVPEIINKQQCFGVGNDGCKWNSKKSHIFVFGMLEEIKESGHDTFLKYLEEK